MNQRSLWLSLALACHGAAAAASPTEVPDRQAEVHRDLGERTVITEVEGFMIAAPWPGDTTGASAIARRALQAFFNGRFRTRPAEPVLVYLFSSQKPYQAYCRKRWNEPCISSYGFYLGDEGRIVLDVGPGVGTLTHELVHPILRADFPDAPTWLDEGIASLYEGFALGPGDQIRGTRNWRLPRLKQALHRKSETDEVTVSALFALSDSEFRNEKEDLNYALARAFCWWMEQKGWLWPFYHAYRDGFADDPKGERAVESVTGKTPLELDQPFRSWLRAL